MGKQNFSADDGMIKLVGLLLDGQTLTAKSIAQELGIQIPAALRKLRSLQNLRGAVPERVGRHDAVRLATPIALPPVSAGDVAAACLASSFGSALRETALGERLRKLVDRLVARCKTHRGATDLDRKFWFVVRGGEKALPKHSQTLDDIVEAILTSKSIRFSYQHFNGKHDTVSALPLTLAVHEHQFYVVCRRPKDGSYYPYRFSRISRLEVRGGFKYPSDSEYHPKNVFRDSFGVFIALDAPAENVRIRLDQRWAPYVASHRWHESQTSRPNENGSVDVTLHVRICPELVQWIRSFGHEAEVVEPDRVRDDVAGSLRKAAARYTRKKARHATRARARGPEGRSTGAKRSIRPASSDDR